MDFVFPYFSLNTKTFERQMDMQWENSSCSEILLSHPLMFPFVLHILCYLKEHLQLKTKDNSAVIALLSPVFFSSF